MYHGNLMAGVLGALLPSQPAVLWNIRSTVHTPMPGTSLSAVFWAGMLLSWGMPRRIIFNSARSLEAHGANGWQRSRSIQIANGFDCERFRPQADAASALKSECSFPEDAIVIGHVARLDPVKDHAGLLQAFGLAVRQEPRLRLVCVGTNVVPSAVADGVGRHGIVGKCAFLGERGDIPRITAGFDFAVLSSRSEAFPNAVGEAMACGVPCVVTDVGDAAELVGDTGIVVAPADPLALALGMLRLAAEGEERRHARGLRARERLVRRWALAGICAEYERLYADLALRDRTHAPARSVGTVAVGGPLA